MTTAKELSKRPALLIGGLAISLTTLGVGAAVASSHGGQGADAKATLRLANGTKIGMVRFNEENGLTRVRVSLHVPAGATAVRAFHGFHVHANDVATNGEGCIADPAALPSTWFVSADGHLKAGTELHADHVGDMPSLHLNSDGSASATFLTERVPELNQRAVIFHAGPDNFANVPLGTLPDQYSANSQAAIDKTKATGNAGDRIACGVITAHS